MKKLPWTFMKKSGGNCLGGNLSMIARFKTSLEVTGFSNYGSNPRMSINASLAAG
jgi:hypothetical protein